MKKPKQNLEQAFPEIAKQWHPTKNRSLKPENFTPGSDQKIWWIGKCGHTWKAVIKSRTKGRSCPYCANRLVLSGFNDLATTHPEIAKQWCYERNQGIKPSDFMAGSTKKVWWVGSECGHEWETSLRNRTARGSGCLVCCGKQVLIGFNDLVTTHPELAKQWHPLKNDLKPDDFTGGSHKKVWWICKRGHSWKATIGSRASSGVGCAYCSGKKMLSGFNDFATLHPDILLEWDYNKNHGIDPYHTTATAKKKVWWRGLVCGHEWDCTVSNRTSLGQGCPYCSGQKILRGFNDLGTTHPQLIKEWHPTKNTTTPYEIGFGSKKIVWWKSPVCGHEWPAPVVKRTSVGRGCRECAKRSQTSKGELEVSDFLNDLGIKHKNNFKSLKKDGISELDIYIPDRKIAFEFNGLHWHSDRTKDKDAHYKKWKNCQKLGIELFYIWEDDWKNNKTLVKDLILNLLSPKKEIPNQKVEILDIQRAKDFMNDNHLQGYISSSLHLGLLDDTGNIRSCLFFRQEKQDLIITQYFEDHQTKGALKLLLDDAIRQTDSKRVILHLDNSSLTNIHTDLEFEFSNELPIGFTYLSKKKRIRSSRKQDAPKIYDAGKSYTLFK